MSLPCSPSTTRSPHLTMLIPATAALVLTSCGAGNALNQKAEAAGSSSIDPLHATGSQGSKISLGALLSTGIKLCGKRVTG